MASKKSMILRIQTNEGMKRVEVSPADTINKLYEKIADAIKQNNGFKLCKDRAYLEEIIRNSSKTLRSLKLGHGDIIYVKSSDILDTRSRSSADSSKSSSPRDSPLPPSTSQLDRVEVTEDEIDVLLSHESGLIHREKHPQFCRHTGQGKCLHCIPLEPYDEEYLKTLKPPAKHLSFHAYLKKLKSGASKGKYVWLEDVNCKIKPGCTDHPPWPKGICTKCQPSAVILNRQKYRHVDNIMFENPIMMDRFLNYWRQSGCQRLGYLYGKYEKHDNVPLGIRATVAAIYEPPQESTRDCVKLLDDPNEEAVDILTSHLGLTRVGWILTDLIPDENTSGQVKYLRHKDSHFMSAQECITAAYHQNKYTNPCKESANGKFGSKFVSVIVSGHEDKHIHYDGWQVSNQCMALVRDECLLPTIDDPALGYVKESSSDQFVPDVFYKEKDTYGNEVTKNARPMPIEYFLIEVPAGFPLEPIETFIGHPSNPFPIENRALIGETQNFDSLIVYLRHISANLMAGFCDLHFLLFLMNNDTIPLRHKMIDLCKILKSRDETKLHGWLESEEWKTVEQMMEAYGPSVGESAVARPPRPGSVEMMDTGEMSETNWTCPHCTFINPSSRSSCDMCSLPKNF